MALASSSTDRGSAPRVVLVSTPYVASHFAKVADQLRASGIEVTEYDSAQDCLAHHSEHPTDVILAMHNFPLSCAFLASLPRLRGALSFITGTECFDEAAATELGILVTNGQTAENFHSMAEATLMLILASFYDLRGAEQALRANESFSGRFRASMLMGKTLGIVGFGKIAQALLERLRGWGVRIQVYTRRHDVQLPEPLQRVELDELCRTSDCIVLLTNLTRETHHLMDARRLKLIKPGAVLVNTARGGLIDEKALVKVAQSGAFRMLALDTFESEPLPLDSALRDLPNAILTGHNVGHTVETHEALVTTAVDNIKRMLRGELPMYIRNPQVIHRWLARWGGPA
jgi:phosphoglycerate dehydrogenase-like enzyme